MPVLDIACSTYTGKIILVIMAGEHRTQIRDESSSRLLTNDNYRNNGDHTIALFEDTIYLLRIQLDCNQAWIRDTEDRRCSLAYDVNVWIDLNDDGYFDHSENAAPYRWPLYSYTPEGVYDLQLYIPSINITHQTRGPHRMRLVITMNDQYRRKCGDAQNYEEIREYFVWIVPKTGQLGK